MSLWALGVGYVISGEYFGWNLGLPVAGSFGMLAAAGLVTVLYVCFVLAYAELACAMPRAGGAFVYAERALGPRWGAIAGFVQAIELVFAPPAIAMAIGSYIAARSPALDPRLPAAVAYVLFTALNAWGVRQAAAFELAVTVLAVGELALFIGVAAPSFSWASFSREPLPSGWSGALAALPFAIWLYLGIEGVANAAEEARNPGRDVARGFGAAMATLVVLALGVFFTAVGVAGWRAVVYPSPGAPPSDAPLPLALAHVVGRHSTLYTLLLGVGLLGLVASFHGILLAAGRATFELGRAGLLPAVVGRVHPRTRTPAAALLLNMALGLVAIASGRTGEIITLACFGASSLYALAMVAFFVLRRREPTMARPFVAPGHPVVPGIALALAASCFASLAIASPTIAAIFAGLLALGILSALRRPAH